MYPGFCTNTETDAERKALCQIVQRLEDWSGCPFSHYKEGTLRRRIERRMMLSRQPDFESYLCYLTEHPDELQLLLESLTLKVSEFFRDKEVFETIEAEVLPGLIQEGSEEPEIRAWSTACALGEEPYSLAIMLTRYLETRGKSTSRCTILGTDIDPTAVGRARLGVFKKERLGSVYGEFREYFVEHPHLKEGEVQVIPRVRNIVDFYCFDVSTPRHVAPPQAIFAEYDIIFVRNVMIYYDDEVKERIVRKLYACLRPGGILVLGRSEVLPEGWHRRFAELHRSTKIYRRRE